QNAPGPVRTPYAFVTEPSCVAKYHGMTRSGIHVRHSRSPYARSHESPMMRRVLLTSPRQRRYNRLIATDGVDSATRRAPGCSAVVTTIPPSLVQRSLV